jgi:hypothetical protein
MHQPGNMDTSGGPRPLAERLIAALTAQRAIYIELAALAKKQSDFVNTYDTEKLVQLLAARSRLLEQIAPLDRQLQPYKNCWQETLQKCDPVSKKTISMLLVQVRQLLADILERDEADKEVLIRQKAQVAGELRHTVTGAQLNRAYGAKPRMGGTNYQG